MKTCAIAHVDVGEVMSKSHLLAAVQHHTAAARNACFRSRHVRVASLSEPLKFDAVHLEGRQAGTHTVVQTHTVHESVEGVPGRARQAHTLGQRSPL